MASPVFVLIHGAWHDHRTWDEIAPRLIAGGSRVLAPDLPGAGLSAPRPSSYHKRPLDRPAYAAEPSPNAAVTQRQRTDAVIDLIDRQTVTDDRIVLVGHSLGGVTVTAVGEALAERVAALVYLCAFMLAPGESVAGTLHDPGFAGEGVGPLQFGDPRATGALRLDPASDDPAYRAALKKTFYGDLSDAETAAIIATLHPDEPLAVVIEPAAPTPARWGRVPRHYIRCTADRAIPIAGQDAMIARIDAAFAPKTRAHTMAASHSPFRSQPDALAGLLLAITGTIAPSAAGSTLFGDPASAFGPSSGDRHKHEA